MAKYARIIEHLIINQVANGGMLDKKKSAKFTFLNVFMALLLTAAIGFLSNSLNIWLNTVYSPETASLFMALFFAVIFVMTLVSIMFYKYMRRKHVHNIKDKVVSKIFDQSYLKELGVNKYIKENPKTSVTIASIFGYIIAEKIL